TQKLLTVLVAVGDFFLQVIQPLAQLGNLVELRFLSLVELSVKTVAKIRSRFGYLVLLIVGGSLIFLQRTEPISQCVDPLLGLALLDRRGRDCSGPALCRYDP